MRDRCLGLLEIAEAYLQKAPLLADAALEVHDPRAFARRERQNAFVVAVQEGVKRHVPSELGHTRAAPVRRKREVPVVHGPAVEHLDLRDLEPDREFRRLAAPRRVQRDRDDLNALLWLLAHTGDLPVTRLRTRDLHFTERKRHRHRRRHEKPHHCPLLLSLFTCQPDPCSSKRIRL